MRNGAEVRNRLVISCLFQSFVITVVCLCLVITPWAVSGSFADTAPKLLLEKVQYALFGFYLLFLAAWFWLIAPAFWCLFFFGLLIWNKFYPPQSTGG